VPTTTTTTAFVLVGSDKIIDSLPTSSSAYNAANTDEWIAITAAEYTNLQTNVSGTAKVGISDIYLSSSGGSGFGNNGSGLLANSVTSDSPAIPANTYLFAFAVKWVNTIPTQGMRVYTNTNSSVASGFNQVGGILPPTTSAGISYYVRKGVSAINGVSAGILACFSGTKLDYPSSSFPGSIGYVGFKYIGNSTAPSMRYLTTLNSSIPGPNVTLPGNLSDYGALSIQGLTTGTRQWA
jgi:hypothetical protein